MKMRLFCCFAVLACLFSSCSDKTVTYRIGVSQCSEDLWRETVNKEIMREAALYGNMEVEIRSVRDDSKKQIADIEYFISKKVDVLVVSPNESAELTPVITKAFQSGIPVILLDRKIDNDQYTAYVGGDNRQIGYMAAEYIIALLKGKGDVIVVRGTKGSTADTERYEGFLKALEDIESDVRIIDEFHADFLFIEAKDEMLHTLEANEFVNPADVVFAFNDQMAYGVSEAYTILRDNFRMRMSDPYIIGIDALNGAGGGVEYLSQDFIDATFLYPTGGDTVIEIARNILSGAPYRRDNILTSTVVDKTNLRLYTLQVHRIDEQQKKVEELNSKVTVNMAKFNRQQQLFYMICVIVIAFMVLISALYMANRTKNRLNAQLREQNINIKKHVEDLQLQKNQLVDLSNRLEETTQAKLVFFTNISHEFKTPLALISGPVEDLLSRGNLGHETKKTLEIVHRNTSKLERLITELLDFRTYENGKMVINYSMGNLKSFLENINEMFEDVIRRRNITFVFDVEDTDFNIPFDAKKMEKVYTNLMSNAFNHLDKDGTIRVTLASEGKEEKMIRLAVFNSGSFVPESERENIFHRFYTLDARQKGTGIGLALITAIVDALGGYIRVESEEGLGTEFIVYLPVETEIITDSSIDDNYVPDFARQKLATMVDEDMSSGIIEEMVKTDKPTVLVIEDNIDMRHYVKSVMSKDYHVLLACDGEIGIKKAAKFSPSLILCDIMMPGMDGFEVCRTLRACEQTANIPIVLLTACSLEEQKVQGYEEGADAFVQKPFNVRTLKTIMRNLIDKSAKVSHAVKGDWLLGKEGSIDNKSQQFLDGLRVYVEEHIHEDISVDAMAAYLGFSKSKLYRELKEITEYSPIDIVNLIKLRKAVNLMLYDGLNISEAAFQSGFSSPSYFSRTFQKYYHERPKDYVKRNSASF